MQDKTKTAVNRDVARRTTSLIAPGTRIEGRVDFVGHFQLRGEISGDVHAENGSDTFTIDTTGKIEGSLQAARISIRGQMHGPIESAVSIEVHEGGASVGDLRYRTLRVHAGGVVAGMLEPLTALEPGTRHATEPSAEKRSEPIAAAAAPSGAVPETSASAPSPTAAAEPSPPARKANVAAKESGNRLGWAFGIGVPVAVVALTTYLTAPTPPHSAMAPDTPPPPSLPAVSALPPTTPAPPLREPSENTEPPKAGASKKDADKPAEEKKGAAVPAPEPVAEKATAKTSAAPEPAPERPEPAISTAVTIKGVNPDRPGNVVYIVTREPAVLYKRKRQEGSPESRMSFPTGRNTRIRISPDELMRVAQGEDLDLYFQGGKIWSQHIANGNWMQFEVIEPPPPKAKPVADARPPEPAAKATNGSAVGGGATSTAQPAPALAAPGPTSGSIPGTATGN